MCGGFVPAEHLSGGAGITDTVEVGFGVVAWKVGCTWPS
jgi:hypothetical protein